MNSPIPKHQKFTRLSVGDTVAQEMRRITALAKSKPLMCMGCQVCRLWPAGQLMPAVYVPTNPAFRALSYVICTRCASDEKKRQRAYLAAETISRADAEGVFEC